MCWTFGRVGQQRVQLPLLLLSPSQIRPLAHCSASHCRSASKARFRDWAALQQKYGASVCMTLPLEVGAGVVGSVTADVIRDAHRDVLIVPVDELD